MAGNKNIKMLYDKQMYSQKYIHSSYTNMQNKTSTKYTSEYRKVPSPVTMHPPTINAGHIITRAMDGISYNEFDNKLAIGVKENKIIVELINEHLTEIIIYDCLTGEIQAGSIALPRQEIPFHKENNYNIHPVKVTGTTPYLIPIIYYHRIRDIELQNALSSLDKGGADDNNELILEMYPLILTDNIYSRLHLDSTEAGFIPLNLPANGNIRLITKENIESGEYSPTEVWEGEFTLLKPVNGNQKTNKYNAGNIKGAFILNENRVLTAQEEKLVPDIPDWYQLPNEVSSIVQHLKMTANSNKPIKNIMLRSAAGTGKTEMSKAIAAAVNLPYMFLTCSANSEIFDLIGQMLPDVESKEINKLPSYSDIAFDPAAVYKQLTGEYVENITEDEVFAKVIELGTPKDKEQRFKYVDSPLIQAIRHGYVVEIQEPSVIANPGVLVGLNGLLDTCEEIQLVTGEVIKRHPDTVIILTTNNDYNGCRNINQSVISRMDLVIDVEEPEINEVINRLRAITGCNDDNELRLMAETVNEIQTFCNSNQINEGVCGMRELISWVQSYQITGDIAKSAEWTILSSVTAD